MNQELAESILKWEDHPEDEFIEEVTQEVIEDQRRWSTQYSQVFKDIRDNTFWEIWWSRGSTEMQDEGPEDIGFQQVEPVEVTVTKYLPVKKGN
jgi:hypothetical protein